MSQSPEYIVNLPNIHFPEGLEGLKEYKNFDLQQTAAIAPVALLNSTDDKNLSFVVVEPVKWFESYKLDISEEQLAVLGADDSQKLLVFVIIDIAENSIKGYANLLGPLVINPQTGKGLQVIQHGGPYLARQPIELKTRKVKFQEGILGFPEWKTYILHESVEMLPVKLLVCAREPEISFMIIHPLLIKEDYAPDLSDEDYAQLINMDMEKLDWYVLLNINQAEQSATANLKAPIVIDTMSGQAWQFVLAGEEYNREYEVPRDAISKNT